MTLFLTFIFFFSIFLLVFTYGGYILPLLPFLKNRASLDFSPLPEITMVIAAYNEEAYIAAKIANCQELDYPSELLRILVITDGSTDKTQQIAATHSGIEVMHSSERMGKTAALNRAISQVKTPITVISDANTALNKEALRHLAAHYEYDDVGGVSGEKKIISGSRESAAGAGEGLYWKYESFLKRIDSKFYSLAGAPGELVSFRTHLYDEMPPSVILDDFMLSMKICAKGFRVVYEPKAYAMETASANIKEELKRKIRICAGGFQAMRMLKDLISLRKHTRIAYIYFSHRVLRWAVAPWCILTTLVSNIFLVTEDPFFFYFAILQGFFYFQVVLGWLFKDKNIPLKGFFVPYYFIIMNYAALAGLFKYLSGNQSAAWERSQRATIK